jgi:Spy/CpxP family protein refolding chaperone
MRTKVLLIAVLLGLTTVAMAQPKEKEKGKELPAPKHEMRMEHRNGGPLAALELTDAQKEAFKQSRLATQKQLQPIRNELGEAEAHQKTLMSAEKPDLAAVNKNIERIGSLKVEMAKIRAKNHMDMRAQLTEEQRLKFDAMKGKMKEGMREGNGMRNFREMPGREKHDLE